MSGDVPRGNAAMFRTGMRRRAAWECGDVPRGNAAVSRLKYINKINDCLQ